eukprot:scaffold179111_cov30-Cyclotella_meneghiniana.AAC.1
MSLNRKFKLVQVTAHPGHLRFLTLSQSILGWAPAGQTDFYCRIHAAVRRLDLVSKSMISDITITTPTTTN